MSGDEVELYFNASVEAEGETTASTDQLEDLVEVLADLGAVGAAVSTRDGNRLGATFTLYSGSYSAEELARSASAAVEIFSTASEKIGVPLALVERVDVLAGPSFERWLEQPAEELAGVTEIARLFGVSKQRISELRARADFPAPDAELAAGPVWKVSNLRRFLETWERRPGRPRRARDSLSPS